MDSKAMKYSNHFMHKKQIVTGLLSIKSGRDAIEGYCKRYNIMPDVQVHGSLDIIDYLLDLLADDPDGGDS